MAFSQLTQPQDLTQRQFELRHGRRPQSSSSNGDISDVICILHPTSPVAFRIATYTARDNPQHVLQNQNLKDAARAGTQPLSQVDPVGPEQEQDKDMDLAIQPIDLALRFSSTVANPALGFVFGRARLKSDINLDAEDQAKRVSNVHFRIFINESGVLMLEDMSTNGTYVDGVALGGKRRDTLGRMVQKNASTTMMLTPGSIIEILSENPNEIIKFVLRIPSRDGHVEAYKHNYSQYMMHRVENEQRAAAVHHGARMPDGALRGHLAAPFAGPPNPKTIPGLPPNMGNEYGMRWDGGETFKCTGVLGTGAFATVYQVATRTHGELFAAKELTKARFVKNGRLDPRLDNEMQIMQELRHPNIVQYVDYYETAEQLYIIMEYLPYGDISSYLKTRGNVLQEHLAKPMTRQILQALKYLHEKNITHRDLKPDNILIASEDPFVVKLTDFGLSKVVKNNDTFLKTFCGTLLYCAPEVFPQYDSWHAAQHPKRRRYTTNSKRSYSQLVDIWSYAAVLWYVLCNEAPFEGVMDRNGNAMFDQIIETNLDVTPLKSQGISDACIDLLLRMLKVDPSQRLDEVACLEHAWLRDETDSDDGQHSMWLESISEADEELDASQLRINDDGYRSTERNDDYRATERMVGLEDSQESFSSFSSREHKRLRPDEYMRVRRQQPIIESEGASSESVALSHTEALNGQIQRGPPRRRKLFGEISSSDLLGPEQEMTASQHAALLNGRAHAQAMDVSCSSSDLQPPGVPENAAWVRNLMTGIDMLMAQQGPTNRGANPQDANHEPQQAQEGPKTPAQSQKEQQQAVSGDQEETPRAKQQSTFRRKIDLLPVASCYYDARDKSTQNIEYASKVSGLTFDENGDPIGGIAAPLPHTIPSSAKSSKSDQEMTDNGPDKENTRTSTNGVTQVARKTPTSDSEASRSVGRLITTSDSVAKLEILLTQAETTWGRHVECTHVYSSPNDLRIGKIAFVIKFVHTKTGRAVADGQDWSNFKDLHTVISTRSSKGIYVNGVYLPEFGEDGKRCYGELHYGDEITVWSKIYPDGHGERFTFRCEISVGAARKKRKDGVSKFEVKHSTSFSSS